MTFFPTGQISRTELLFIDHEDFIIMNDKMDWDLPRNVFTFPFLEYGRSIVTSQKNCAMFGMIKFNFPNIVVGPIFESGFSAFFWGLNSFMRNSWVVFSVEKH